MSTPLHHFSKHPREPLEVTIPTLQAIKGVHTGASLALFLANLCIQPRSADHYDLCWKFLKINIFLGYYGVTRHETRLEHVVVQYQLGLSSTSVQRGYDRIWYTSAEFIFSLNFTRRITGQAWWFSNNLSFSMCQTRWSTFCFNFSRCNTFNSFILYYTIPYYIEANRFENSSKKRIWTKRN